MMEHASKPIYALQFHPEVTHTEEGQNLLENFIVEVCHCNKDWQMHHLIENRITEIREQTGNSRVLLELVWRSRFISDSSITFQSNWRTIGLCFC